MSTGLYAVQHTRRMRGGSQSHLMRASDGACYVVKFQNNPQHLRVLANEMLATRLAQWLGLPVPKVEVVEISDWLIANTPELRVEVGGSSVLCSSGRQLGSLYCGDERTLVFDYLPEKALERVANVDDFARVLVFDKWTANNDGRQAVFTRKTARSRYRATFIDHGYCFNAGEWTFADSPHRGVYAHSCVYSDVRNWDSFEPALSKAESIEPSDLWQFTDGIPEEWCGGDRATLELEKLLDTLFRRRGVIRNLINEFRCSSRNPFPNWSAAVFFPGGLLQEASRSPTFPPEFAHARPDD